MDLVTARLTGNALAKEVEKLSAGLAGGGLSQHLSGLNVQRSIERKSAMPIVLETVAFGPPGRKWQDWIQPIKGLDRAFLIEAEYRRIQRWIKGKTNKVGGHFFNLQCLYSLEITRAVWLQPALSQLFSYGRLND